MDPELRRIANGAGLPRSPLELVDAAFSIIRARPKTIAAIGFGVLLPIQLLTIWAAVPLLDAPSVLDDSSWLDNPNSLGSPRFGFGLGAGGLNSLVTLVTYAALPILGGALTGVILHWRRGHHIGGGQALRAMVGRLPALAAGFVITKAIQIGTLGLTTPILAQVAPIIVAERKGPIRATQRAFALSWGRYWPLLGLQLLVLTVTIVVGGAFSTIPTLVAMLLGSWGWFAPILASAFVNVIMAVVAVGASVLVYFDLLDRYEGRDLAERIAELGVDDNATAGW